APSSSTSGPGAGRRRGSGRSARSRPRPSSGLPRARVRVRSVRAFRVRQRVRRPVQAALFELEEGLYAQEETAWAKGVRLAGVDEVGRGPLAGPVVAAV